MNQINCFLTVSLVLMMSCSSVKQHQDNHFKLDKAYYQSWAAGGGERGVDIVLTLSEVNPKVEFKDIYFRKQIAQIKKRISVDTVTIIGTLVRHSKYMNETIEEVESENQLNYTIGGKVYRLPLNNIERKPMQYN